MAWGATRIRDLPWRRVRDPWAILVSEVMLQQTQISRVIPRWLQFLERWPTAEACANAELGDVLAAWQGLGYPRRARNLHAAATAITSNGRAFPATLDGLRALPGVGEYTARAVLAFAFERDEAVVDTNIARLLARLAGQRLSGRQVRSLADQLVAQGDGWTWNQVLMDVGATICRPQPLCSECPVRHACAWRRAGAAAPDPAVSSAAVSRPQGRFEGSDRQARGKLMRLLADQGAVSDEQALMAMGVDRERCDRLIADLLREGLVDRRDDRLVFATAR